MSLARDTIRGALWTISSGMGSRTIGLFGTLIVTRFITPADYGEVTVAAVLVMSANQLSTIGFGQYLVANPTAPRSVAFHVTAFHLLLGVLALAVLLAAGGALGPWLDAPRMTRFLPGLVLSGLFDRAAFVPERVLVRELRFAPLSMVRTVGDLAHSALSVTLAALGWGGAAIVMGNVARSTVRFVGFAASVERRDWLEPCRLSLRQTRELLEFGVPMSLGALCAFAARRWDNLLVARFFGPGPTGMYNLAYNLADVPAIQVGEQIGDVLLPSFARIDLGRRPAALVRSMALLALVVFPLAVGLGAVAPSLVATLFDARWRPIAPMLVLLSALSVARPVGWTVASYLQARQMPRLIFWLELWKLVLLIGGICTFGRISPEWTCAAVGVSFGLHGLASLWVVRRLDRVPLRRSLGSLAPALGACLAMVVGILLVRHALGALGPVRPAFELTCEVLVGAVTYLLAALVLAREASRELLGKVSDALRSHPVPE
ncbi:MAG TPA: oligosaccharide flippase family protein [Polyangiaceae bacterium]